MKRRLALILALPLLVNACGGGSSNSSNAADPPGALSGNWQISLQSSGNNPAPHPESGFLQQAGEAVTGSVYVSETTCSGIGGVSGTASENNVSLTVSPTGSVINLTGTMNSGGASMGGSYLITSSGCDVPGVVPDSGSWTANLVQPVNGTIQGTMTSTSKGTFTVTGQITQAANSGGSTAALSGTLNLSAGYCFSTATIVGSISGTGVVINLVDSDGNQLGAINGSATLDGTTVTGNLRYLGQGSTGAAGCQAASANPITLTL